MKIENLEGKHFFICTACMSVYADALSWCNANTEKVVRNVEEADNIIVLSCQVTDLAVLNDIRTAEYYRDTYPDKKVYISGCLAARSDIPLPENVCALHQMRTNYQHINDKTLVQFAKPFWVKDFKDSSNELDVGNIFRNKYPLRIGKGCIYNCTYCTIRKTRGAAENLDITKQIDEFKKFDDVVLIAESPTSDQILAWCSLAIYMKKKISFRNVEPLVAVHSEKGLLLAAKMGVLDTFHCPIQSSSAEVLKDMHRRVVETFQSIVIASALKSYGVKIATNIICDYKHYPNNFDTIYRIYDYVSWNPYWDNCWDRSKAEERFLKYCS